MKLIVIHGSGSVGVSNKLTQIKKDFDPLVITEVSSKSTTWGQVKTEILSVSLFNPKRLVILEDIKEVKLEELPTDKNLTLVLKFTKALTAANPILKAAPKLKAQVFEFTEEGEASIFPILDLLAEKNPRALRELEKNLAEWGEQYLLTMIYYLLRRNVEIPKKSPPFIQQKLAKQRANFPRERIEELYRATLETDFKIKQGEMDPRMGMFMLVEKFLDVTPGS